MRALWPLFLLLALACGSAQAQDVLAPARAAMTAQRVSEADAMLREVLQRQPDHEEARFLLARVLAWQARYEESTREWQWLLQRSPSNSDYLFGQAQVLVWSGQPRAALPLLAAAQERSLADPDIWRLRIQALVALAEPAARDEALQLQAQAQQRFADQGWNLVPALVSAPQSSPAAPVARVADELDRAFEPTKDTHLSAGWAFDQLSKGHGQWRARTLALEHRLGPRKVVYASVQETDRFHLRDRQWQAGAYYPLPYDTTLNVEVAANADAHMLPSRSAMASLQAPLSSGWFATGGLRRSAYTSGASRQAFGLLECYVQDYRWAYTLTSTQAHGVHVVGHRVALSRYYSDVSFVSLNLGRGREVENVAGRNVFFSTAFVGLSGRHGLNKDWALNWALGQTRQDTAYTRRGVELGLRRAF